MLELDCIMGLLWYSSILIPLASPTSPSDLWLDFGAGARLTCPPGSSDRMSTPKFHM